MTIRQTKSQRHARCEPGSDTVLAHIGCIGIEAQCLLTALDKSRVVAVFRRCIYLRLGDAWACFGGNDIGRAPLNVLCRTTGFADWRDVTLVEDAPVVGATGFSVGKLKLIAEGATVWENHRLPSSSMERLNRGLRHLTASLPAGLPREGLAPLLLPDAAASSLVSRAALSPVKELSDWVLAGSPQRIRPVPREALHRLLGLGPGLTPSGDDFLAGFVSGLRAAGRADAAQALGRELIALAPGCTSALSAAHLRAALRAGLKEDLQRLLHALLEGEPSKITTGIRRLEGQPHYSSWDTLAGITAALGCALGRRGEG